MTSPAGPAAVHAPGFAGYAALVAAAPPPTVLEMHAVSRAHGSVVALWPATLLIQPGSLVVIHGPNGAGKSTLLRVAAGLLRPTSGTRRCHGRAVYLSPSGGGRNAERVADAVRFTSAARGERRTSTVVADALGASGLAQVAGRRVGSLSTGERARLLLAHLRAARPEVACLDEPTAHLDSDGTQSVLSGIGEAISLGTAVLVATHAPMPFLSLRPVVLEMDRGRITATATGAPGATWHGASSPVSAR